MRAVGVRKDRERGGMRKKKKKKKKTGSSKERKTEAVRKRSGRESGHPEGRRQSKEGTKTTEPGEPAASASGEPCAVISKSRLVAQLWPRSSSLTSFPGR